MAKDANLGFGKFSGNHFSFFLFTHIFSFFRRGVAEWSAPRTRNQVVPGSSRFSHFPGFVLGRPELKSSATLVNSQLIASFQLGFLILLCALSTINKPLTFFFFALLLIFCWGSIPVIKVFSYGP